MAHIPTAIEAVRSATHELDPTHDAHRVTAALADAVLDVLGHVDPAVTVVLCRAAAAVAEALDDDYGEALAIALDDLADALEGA